MTALIIERIWEAPTRDEVADAFETLGVTQDDIQGLVGFQGNAFVHIGQRIIKTLGTNPTADEARALAVLLTWHAVDAEEKRDAEGKWDERRVGNAERGRDDDEQREDEAEQRACGWRRGDC